MTDVHLGPLTGVKVVDLTIAVQGPHASAYLADMGADVVKIERPGGELNRHVHGHGFSPPPGVPGTQYVAMNRNKRGMVVDAHSEVGREVLRRLVVEADVLVTNYRRDALERMGLTYEQLAPSNPRLIHARVSGFGPRGPQADKAMLDGAAQARSGLAAISGPVDGPPMPPGAAVADHGGSMQLALGVMTALFARERTGRGQQVDISALGAMMWLQAWEIAHTSMSTESLRRSGPYNANIKCPYGVYETADGGSFLLAVAMSDASWDAFWIFADRPEVVADPRWNNGAKRIGARGSADGVDEIRELVATAFASKTTRAWEDFLLGEPEIIWERVRTYEELFTDPQVIANEYLADVDVAGFGTAKVVTNVVQLSDTPGSGVRRGAPNLGEHTAEVMSELGFSDDEIAEVLGQNDGVAEAIRALIFDD